MLQDSMNRRKFFRNAALAAAGTTLAAGCNKIFDYVKPGDQGTGLMKRVLGKTGFKVTTLGLGGQAALQWTPEGVDPVKIILKAFDRGINYFDTANSYGPGQLNYGKAFRQKNLIPGLAAYDNELRRSVFLTSKTAGRYASDAVNDLHRSLSQIFGNDDGNYPAGAYLDMMMIHCLETRKQIDLVYEGLDDPGSGETGALAALRDYRDGTNLTGLNQGNEKLIHHIGFSGHSNPSVNMHMIQRDRTNLLYVMLVPVNANDKLMFNMQYNVIPLATAKNMGVIAMKVFADGAMYTKPPQWSTGPEHVIRTVGSEELPSNSLIQYSLTTPGVHLAITGIGQISDNSEECQLYKNLEAAQILSEGLTEAERTAIEEKVKEVTGGDTNYFQDPALPLTAPKEVIVAQYIEDSVRKVFIIWHTAYAADAFIKSYEIWRDGTKITEIPYYPQITTDPFRYLDTPGDQIAHTYIVKVVDGKGRVAESPPATLGQI